MENIEVIKKKNPVGRPRKIKEEVIKRPKGKPKGSTNKSYNKQYTWVVTMGDHEEEFKNRKDIADKLNIDIIKVNKLIYQPHKIKPRPIYIRKKYFNLEVLPHNDELEVCEEHNL